MGKQYSETPSWVKQKASDAILHCINLNKQYYLQLITDYIVKHNPTIQAIPVGRNQMIVCVPEEHKKELTVLVDIYMGIEYEMYKSKWYLNNIFTHAENLDVIKKTIPEYYWKYIYLLPTNGYKDSIELFDRECFNILEQAKINNVLLGLTG
jgi:hypothetical protein